MIHLVRYISQPKVHVDVLVGGKFEDYRKITWWLVSYSKGEESHPTFSIVDTDTLVLVRYLWKKCNHDIHKTLTLECNGTKTCIDDLGRIEDQRIVVGFTKRTEHELYLNSLEEVSFTK